MRMNERAARLTAAHFEFPGAHEPRFDQDGRVIYHDPVSGLPLARDGEAPGYARRRVDHVDQRMRQIADEVFRLTPGVRASTQVQSFAPARTGNVLVDMTRELGERSYIGWWMRQHYRNVARTIGVRTAAAAMHYRGYPLSVALMILVYPDNLGDENA